MKSRNVKWVAYLLVMSLLVCCVQGIAPTVHAAENIAYGRTVTASTEESTDYSASNAVDADGNTRWASAYEDNQYLIVDMWNSQSVSSVKIAWEAAYASQFQIQVSNDNSSWTTVYENYNATGGTQTISFDSVNARYVKLYCIKRATEYGFSVYEFEIYGEDTELSGNDTAKSNIKGKTFFFLGSSVTYGYASNGVSFADYIAERNNCTCIKEAVSGTTLVDNGSDSYVQRMLNNLDASANCDHFVCQLSTNDASQNLSLGTVSDSYELSDFDKSTIIGAMEYIICYAKQTWNCPVTFYTNTYYDSSNYQAMVDALYSLQEKWGIGIIDLWNNEEMRNVSESDYARYMSDNIHPTSAGYLEWWTPVFEEYFQNYDYSEYVSDAGKAKQKVLDYLYSIQGQKTIIGMHNREPNSEPAKQTNQVYSITGQYPALWSGDFLFSSSDVANRWNMIYECKNQWENGSIVNLMLHVTPPTQSEVGSWDGGVVSELSNDQWNSLITDGGELNKAWKSRLDTYATYLQYLEDNGVPVMFRPFHEMNQSMFWWAGRTGTNGTGALFRLTRDYLEIEKGLDNIIWVWDMQDLSYDWSSYNPGNDYWDIFAVDIYNSDYFTTYKYNQALSVAGDKLIAIGECDHLPTADELRAQPRWSFVMSWAELTFSSNTNSEIQNLYWADNVIVRNELPDFDTIEDGGSDEETTVPETTTQGNASVTGGYDLVVTDIKYNLSSIDAGNNVMFTATVKNIGDTDIPSGTVIGVRFHVDGNETVLTWNDQYSGGLKAGDTIDLAATSGTSGNTWTATDGTHTVTAWVDDVNRITGELNEDNNQTNVLLTIPYVTEVETEITTEIPTTVPTETPTETPTEETEVIVEVNGYQISTTVEGFRTVYSISDPNSEVVSAGMLYGIGDVAESSMEYGATGVYNFEATDAGKLDATFSEYADAQSYSMTMQFAKTASFYTTKMNVRAYAKLADGTYIYSDVEAFTVYYIADYLYQNLLMNNLEGHHYLYNNILSVVDSTYKEKDFAWNNSIVKPNDVSK